jgi:hypothetical protein
MQEITFFVLGGLTVAGFGIGLLYAQSKGRMARIQEEEIRAVNPHAPWLWREDWALGRVKSDNRSSLVGIWVFAIFWNLVSSPVAVFVVREEQRDPKVYFALLFPVIGAALLAWALLLTLRWRRFGRTWFEMASVPGVLGKELRGRIWARLPRQVDGILLRLTCVRRTVSGHGKNRSVREDILWREEDTVQQGELQVGADAAAIPVRFALPSDGLDSQPEDADDGIHWILSAEASLPGVNYTDQFEVPVFRTKESSAADAAPEPAADDSPAEVTLQDLAAAGIQMTPGAEGVEFRFGAGRNPWAATAWTGLALLLAAIVWFLWTQEVLPVFLAGFCLLEAILTVTALDFWLGTTKVTIGNGLLRTRHSLLGLGSAHTIAFADVSALQLKVGMQSGGSSGTPYYDIRAVLRNGRERTVAGAIRNKRQAEWLLARMRASIGLAPSLHRAIM